MLFTLRFAICDARRFVQKPQAGQFPLLGTPIMRGGIKKVNSSNNLGCYFWLENRLRQP
jgi:hypothetical protein